MSKTIVQISFENEKQKELFMGWFSNSGEQDYDETTRDDFPKGVCINYPDYKNGIITVTECGD